MYMHQFVFYLRLLHFTSEGAKVAFRRENSLRRENENQNQNRVEAGPSS